MAVCVCGSMVESVYLERELEQGRKKRRRKAGHTPLLIGSVRQGSS